MDEETKLCPLRMMMWLSPSDKPRPATRCIGETCAWWNESAQCCGVIAPGVLQETYSESYLDPDSQKTQKFSARIEKLLAEDL